MWFQKIFFYRHLAEGEKILYAGHKHYIVLFHSVFKFILLGAIIPWGAYYLTQVIIMLWLALVFSFLVLIKFIYALMDWYFDTVLVTNQSVLLLEWNGFFHQKSNRLDYSSIEGGEIELKGLGAKLFRYSDITIALIGSDNITLTQIYKAQTLLAQIMKQKELIKHQKMANDRDSLHELLLDLVQEHISRHGWK
ncbi:MAG TPA: hypothetical protein PLQ36_00660 [Candidatus Gracilibacteria bacterium]|nr:hypothetical protein [Candidatus Gracilibacteria bacterium]